MPTHKYWWFVEKGNELFVCKSESKKGLESDAAVDYRLKVSTSTLWPSVLKLKTYLEEGDGNKITVCII